MNKNAVATPHLVAPLERRTWNDSRSELLVSLRESHPSLSAVLWDDKNDPLQLQSKPYLLEQGWKKDSSVRLDLPPLLHMELTNNTDSRIFRLSNFFISPSECKTDAADSGRDAITGKPIPLTDDQRETLKRYGHIHVPSRLFASQNHHHTWQVARCFYSGSCTIFSDFVRMVVVQRSTI